MSNRRLVSGVGINDADYTVKHTINGSLTCCPYYECWRRMFYRSYSQKFHKLCSTYYGCSVHSEWHSFMSFRAWMIKQDWEGKQLDKDIISPGNKVYSPETCCFVPQSLNKLLTDSASNRGNYPAGVYLYKPTGRYQAYMKIEGVKRSLGYYSTPEEASQVYITAKSAHIRDIAEQQKDIRIKEGLIKHAEMLQVGY